MHVIRHEDRGVERTLGANQTAREQKREAAVLARVGEEAASVVSSEDNVMWMTSEYDPICAHAAVIAKRSQTVRNARVFAFTPISLFSSAT